MATDIVSRGIDVEALGHVVNFDVPLESEDSRTFRRSSIVMWSPAMSDHGAKHGRFSGTFTVSSAVAGSSDWLAS